MTKDRLFDSSAIINLCRARHLDLLINGRTLWLAYYEIGNAVWKQTVLQDKISVSEGEIVVNALSSVFHSMQKLPEEDAKEVFRMGVETGLTFYDAAFLVAAKINQLILVTDDAKLAKIAKKYVPTVSTGDV